MLRKDILDRIYEHSVKEYDVSYNSYVVKLCLERPLTLGWIKGRLILCLEQREYYILCGVG